MTLVYASAANDPVLDIWPTHRLVRPVDGLPQTVAELTARLAAGGFTVEPRSDLATATEDARRLRTSQHAFGVQAPDGTALLTAPRAASTSPRDALDVTVLAERVLAQGLGIGAEAVVGGALAYTRDVAEAERAVRGGEAAVAFTTNPSTAAEIIAVSDAAEVMPQKSTYFYPKVPTGLVLSPL
jgi:uncharacterized protein (DUF1015 family)